MIRAIAREAGERTKIAVMSRDKDVDPVGACVGMKGMRVQSIIRELRGEKIDIIEYHEDGQTFAEKALQPAKVSRVTVVDPGQKQLEVIVDDTPALAGDRQEGAERSPCRQAAGLEDRHQERGREAPGSGAADVGAGHQCLHAAGERAGAGRRRHREAGRGRHHTVESLADMTPEQLEEIPGIGPKTVEKISIAVNNYFSSLEAGEGGGADCQGSEDQPAGEPGGEELNAAPGRSRSESVEGKLRAIRRRVTGPSEAVRHAEAEDLPKASRRRRDRGEQRGRRSMPMR